MIIMKIIRSQFIFNKKQETRIQEMLEVFREEV